MKIHTIKQGTAKYLKKCKINGNKHLVLGGI